MPPGPRGPFHVEAEMAAYMYGPTAVIDPDASQGDVENLAGRFFHPAFFRGEHQVKVILNPQGLRQKSTEKIRKSIHFSRLDLRLKLIEAHLSLLGFPPYNSVASFRIKCQVSSFPQPNPTSRMLVRRSSKFAIMPNFGAFSGPTSSWCVFNRSRTYLRR